MSNSAYIVLEGIDGCGKTTQFNRILAYLGDRAFGVHEPGSTPMGEEIRDLLKNPAIPRSPKTDMFLFSAARSNLIDTIVRPTFRAGKIVVSDRNWLSTVAYQGADEANIEEIMQLSTLATGEFFAPDLLLLFDIDVEVAAERMLQRNSNALEYFETRGVEYFKRVRELYLAIAKKLSHVVVIDSHRSPNDIWQDVEAAIQPFISD